MKRKHLMAMAAILAGMLHPAWAQEMDTASPAVQAWHAFMSSPQELNDLPAERKAQQMNLLGAALLEDPVGVSDDLERSSGGGRALRAYLQAMVEDGDHTALVEQFHVVMHGGRPHEPLADVLNASQSQDGSVWFPQAEQSGFFAGSLAAILDGNRSDSWLPWSDDNSSATASEAIATRFGLVVPAADETAAEWLITAFTNEASAVSAPAAQWFEKGFGKGYR